MGVVGADYTHAAEAVPKGIALHVRAGPSLPRTTLIPLPGGLLVSGAHACACGHRLPQVPHRGDAGSRRARPAAGAARGAAA